jgi:hypothetical protein
VTLTSLDVRAGLVDALRLDLIGPAPGGAHEREVLAQPPSRYYLTGFLVPYEAPAEQRADDTAQERLDLDLPGPGDDDQAPEPASARRAFLPSSAGVSVLLPAAAERVQVTVTWGDYERVELPDARDPSATPRLEWHRTPRVAALALDVGAGAPRTQSHELPDSGGLRVTALLRAVHAGAFPEEVRPPAGTRALAVFVVNHREAPRDAALRDGAMAFQVRLHLRVEGETGFVPRPDPRGARADDWDERVADLHYRDAVDFAVGHGVATHAHVRDGRCHEVETTWLPTAPVERVEPVTLDDVELGLEALAALASAEDARARLRPLVTRYRAWIAAQRTAPLQGRRAETARALLDQAEAVADRLAAGIDALGDSQVFDAFRLANRAMATAARQRESQLQRREPATLAPPRWRPFQLAFILMNLRGLAEPTHAEREAVDLLFFPTGGGKTEAYLGLAAFALVLRRLRRPGIASAGVAVLMRYTLRLLTLDQLGRAAGVVCALELLREEHAELGPWPFEIGLWVGSAATPNRMGHIGDNRDDTARATVLAFQRDSRRYPSPLPIQSCPWCGRPFEPVSFDLKPDAHHPRDLRVRCTGRACPWNGSRRCLPIVAVDEPLYRRLPAFVIATVDKFAGLPYEGRAGALFGRVERHDAAGFYGPCDPKQGEPLPAPLLPPDLIIQDELHLISGPLGTMVGLYETALEALCERREGSAVVRPRIVASTATVRRAERQIQALFARTRVDVFPPPGPDRRDSFFARGVPPEESPARLYVGLAAPGRSPKVMLLRSYLALLGAGQRLREQAEREGAGAGVNPADPYLTLVGYFNSLRELGGSRRIVEDEVTFRLRDYGAQKRVGEAHGLFADRSIRYEPVELTSRANTSDVAEARRRLELPAGEERSVDVALATNMISVGLDIPRLGLMVVLGRPKTTAEYIQATSRVGRDPRRPGLVLSLLNIHRPRDRSHYERFEFDHATFYRAVEATSVTPFSPRALDRGLAAVAVALARHGLSQLTPAAAAIDIEAARARLDFVAGALARRSALVSGNHHDERALRERLLQRAQDLFDEWERRARGLRDTGGRLRYQKFDEASGRYLLHDPLDPELDGDWPAARKFKAARSLRDVEPSVALWLERPGDSPAPESSR